LATIIDVCPLEQLTPDAVRLVEWEDLEIGVFNCAGALYAIEDRCSHDDGPLAEGELDQDACTVECPRHGSLFDLETGKPVWKHATQAFMWGSTFVADGKVYFGAGDDGLFCVDAGDGAIVLDADPILAGGHVEVPESFVRKLDAAGRSLDAGLSPVAATPVSGALTLTAKFSSGSEALEVQGTAPAAVPITLTIFATVDPDIPQVVVDRMDVSADRSGHFSVVVPYAAAFEHNAVLSVKATSLEGVSPASICCLQVAGTRTVPSSSH